ncbi:MAG: hypothetical protein ACKVOJ_11570 [Sphingomonadaceae bacterium]
MTPTATNRSDYQAAADLMAHFGDHARSEAASRASQSRDRGNLIRFCQWRQVERLITLLMTETVAGTVH